MTLVLRFLLLCALALSSIDAWSTLSISPHIYGCDEGGYVYTRQVSESGAQNRHYDNTHNLRYCCNKSQSNDLQEKALDWPFFTLVYGLDVTKGPLWTSTKSKSAVENAFGHYKKHKGEFPEFQNAKQYVEGTQKFLNSPPKGTLTKTRSNGDTLLYNPKTNTFGVKDANGAPRTMFRPKDGMDYWNKQ